MKIKRPSPYDQALKLAQAATPPPKRAYDLLVKADERGDPRATYALATWYFFGSPFTKIDWSRAARMLKQAAEGGISDAAYDLAISYEKGAG